MFTDLNLTDMESCYKVFRRDIIQSINLKENRFGFEPEIIAKIAHLRLRIFETGISYFGRTYEEGKKIGIKDGIRAFYCIFKYNASHAPIPIQFLIYFVIGGISALFNFVSFLSLYKAGISTSASVLIAFSLAALLNYLLSVAILFRHKARWNSITEILIYIIIASLLGFFDLFITLFLIDSNYYPSISKLISAAVLFVLNFLARRYIVFPEPSSGSWKPELP
jgi:putative flippase GtrA